MSALGTPGVAARPELPGTEVWDKQDLAGPCPGSVESTSPAPRAFSQGRVPALATKSTAGA